MGNKVGIVAVAQTKYEERKMEREGELVWEVVQKVLEETGLTFAEDGTGIDATVTCSQDFWSGRTLSNVQVTRACGGHLRPEVKVAGDGALACFYAAMQILSGQYDTVLVVAHAKESQTMKNIIDNAAFDPIYQRLLGLDFTSAAALQANKYMQKYAITPEQCAKVVVKNRRNAKRNPCAQAPLDLTVNEVLSSEIVCYPLRKLECKPCSDGACALVLARENKARRLTSKPVWIRGVASCYDAYYLGDRDLADCHSLIEAAQRAYKMAGITNPQREIDLAEISEEYSYQELLWTEGLGFCNRGEGGKFIDSGATTLFGQLPVNPSGGLLSGRPVNVAGLAAIAEAVLQLRKEAGARQVEEARTAVAHGVGGPCGQLHCVFVLGRD